MATVQQEPKVIARRLAEDVFSTGDLDAFDELFAEEYVNHTIPVPGIPGTKAGFRTLVEATRHAFPDLEVHVDGVVAEGDSVVFHDHVRATSVGEFFGVPPSGGVIEVDGDPLAARCRRPHRRALDELRPARDPPPAGRPRRRVVMAHSVVGREEWLTARLELLAAEKELTRARDEVARARRALPWEAVEKDYVFETPSGEATLADLFAGRSQLVVYHFMFSPEDDWTQACKHCSFWADSFNPNVVHLAARDVTLVAVSRAQLEKIERYRARMGWTFTWASSYGTDFNYDFGVAFGDDDRDQPVYNFGTLAPGLPDREGISVFFRDESGSIHRTYSTYARGIDLMNAAYNYLDLVPLGRGEEGQQNQYWVRRHDEYA